MPAGWGRRGGRTAALAVGLALTATACNGGGGEAAETTTTGAVPATAPTPTSPPPPTVSPEGRLLLDNPDAAIFGPELGHLQSRPNDLAVVRAYVRAEQAWIKSGMAPVNPDHPDLLAAMKGNTLTKHQKVLTDMRDRGEAYQAPRVLNVVPRRVQHEGNTVRLEYCITEHVPVYNVTTGSLVDDRLYSEDAYALMEQSNDNWLLAGRGKIGETRDGATCLD